MTFLKSRSLLLLFLFSFCAEAHADNLYPIAEVSAFGGVNVRRTIDPNSPIIGKLHEGDTFAFKSAKDRYLILDGQFAGGYIAGEFVRITGSEYQLVKTTGTDVLIREAASKTGRPVARISKGAYFAAQPVGNWFEIKDGPHRGKFVNLSVARLINEDGSTLEAAAPMVSQAPSAAASGAATGAATGTGSGTSASGTSSAAAKASAPAASAAPPAPIATPTPKTLGPSNVPVEKPWDEKTSQRFDDQVEKAFKKKKTIESRQVLMPVNFEGIQNATTVTVNAEVLNDSDAKVETNELFRLLRKHIVESWFDKSEVKAISPKSKTALEMMAVSAFHGTGIDVVYDNVKLEIRVVIPSELRMTETQLMSRGREVWGDENADSPSLFSSYINVNATEVFDSRNIEYNDRRTPFHAQLENGTNIGNFVIEANGDYTEKRHDDTPGRSEFIRQDVRVVRDLPSLTARASVGDVIYPVQSFQIYRQLQGVAVYSQFGMDPSKLTYPTGDYEIYLKNKSKVYIWVNDQLQKILDLPAGRHQLKDFQYTSGMNNVRFEIVDEFGQTETQDHSYFSSAELLKTGLQQYGYAIGSPATPDPVTGEKVYDAKNSTFSGFHRYGFNNVFTGGLNAQKDSKQSVYGAETIWSLKKGFLKVEPAFSNTAAVGSGYAVGTRYTYVDYLGPEKTQRSLNVGLVYRSDLFSEFGTTTMPTIARPFNLSVGYSRGISKMLSGNFGFSYLMNKKITDDADNAYSVRIGGSARWANGISSNLSATHSRSALGKDEINIMGYFIWSFPIEKQTISAYTNSADNSSRLGWSYNPSSGADSNSYQANYRDSAIEKGYSVNMARNGNRARTSITHETILTKKDEPATTVVESDQASNVTTLQMGTALVFAGGHFGIGRPVTDGFAIVAPVKSLKGQELRINPDQAGNYLAKTDWLGPAVMPELASYNPTSLTVGAKDLPLGVSIPRDHFNVYPSYKNGYGFELGSDASLYVKFILLGPDGKPLDMASGLATYLDVPDTAPITIFTSRKGQMQSEGFRSGRYRLEIAGYQPLEFVVPEAKSTEVNLGMFTMKAE